MTRLAYIPLLEKTAHEFTKLLLKTWHALRALTLLVLLTACDAGTEVSAPAKLEPEHFVFRFGHDMAESSAHHAAALALAERVALRTQGRLKITVHPNQSLGNDHEMIAMAQAGELDIILPPTAKLSTLSPAMQLTDLPFLFSSHAEAYRVLDGPPGQAMLATLGKHGLLGLAFWESGFKQLTSNHPIDSAADFHGMRFRIMRSAVLRDQFQAWGADTLVVEFGKTLQALRDKVVDGQENPLGTIYNMKFHESQAYLTLTRHGYLAQVLVFSKASLRRLPPALQDVLLDVVDEVTHEQRRQAQQLENRYLEDIRRSGILVSELTAEVRTELQSKARGVLEKHRMSIGTDIVELTLQTLDETALFDEREIVIGLDADLAGNSALSGLAIRRGIELAMDEINADGGVLGKRLRLLTRDNSMISERGMENLRRFAAIPNLVAVVCGISSPVVLSELDFVHKHGILLLDPWAAATGIVDNGFQPNYVFRVSVRDEYAAGFLLPEALKVSDRVALLLSNNAWGRGNHQALLSELAQRGMTPLVTQWFDWGETRYAEKIDALYSAGAEVVVYVGNAIELAGFVKYLAGKPAPLPIISHWGITGANFPELAGEALNKIDLRVLQTFSFIDNPSAKAAEVARQYQRRYAANSPREIVSPTGTAHAYDLVHLLARAISKAGSTDRAAVRDAMENLAAYPGLVTTYTRPFDANRHDALGRDSFFLARYENGALVPLPSR